jgi:hypothetical protein
MLRSTQADTGDSADPRVCLHSRRERLNHSGWFSSETVCSDCGQVFDLTREAQLRDRSGSGTEGTPS